MTKKYKIFLVVIMIFTFSFVGVVSAKDNPNGEPFKAIWEAIEELQAGIVADFEELYNIFVEKTDYDVDQTEVQNQISGLSSDITLLDGEVSDIESALTTRIDELEARIVDLENTCAECCEEPCEPTTEVCDGIDNDCDGEIDEEYVCSCVDLEDESTWDGKIIFEYGGYSLQDDVILCNKTYNLGTASVKIIRSNYGITLDCNDATLVGAGTGSGVLLSCFGSECPLNATVKNCNIDNYGGGVTMVLAKDSVVEDNTFTNVGAGVSLNGGINNIVRNNVIDSPSYTGIKMQLSYLGSKRPNYNEIIGNIITDSNGYGFEISRGFYNTIKDNRVTNSNYHGIYIYEGAENVIYNNYFENASNNAKLFSPSDFLNIWSIEKTAGTNIIGGDYLGGNYWHDYTGEDTDSDGLGDTLLPYDSGGNIYEGGDEAPLVE